MEMLDGIRWEPQYEITGLVMLALFCFFYQMQNVLPSRRNRLFFKLMMTELLCIIVDIVASVVSSNLEKYSIGLIYVLNMAYFLILTFVYSYIYEYCKCMGRERAARPIRKWLLFRIPYWVISVLIITAPITKGIFYIDAQTGYHRGVCYYPVIAGYLLFYMILSGTMLVIYRKYLSRRELASGIILIVCTLIPSLIQIFIAPYVLLTNMGISLGLAVVYLAMQNPEYEVDQKTRVFNGSGFDRYVGEQMRMNKNVKCIAIGFANYTNIRSVYGEKKTDYILNRIGVHLKNSFSDTVPFYMHNGYFILVLKNMADVENIRQRLVNYFAHPHQVKGDEIYLQLRSVYIERDEKISNSTELQEVMLMTIKSAKLLDYAKLHVIEDADIASYHKDKAIRHAMHESIEKDYLEVYFQPIYDIATKRFSTAEALVRINHPNLGLIMPDSFIRIAEEDGTILHLGMEVFRKVCEFIHNHNMEELGLKYIEVNLSPIQCMYKSLARELVEVAEQYQVDMHYINFEITETAMADHKTLGNLMNALIQKGATFALDDYGTGFSNLVNVMKLPFHVVKIDKSIVWGYFDGSDAMLKKLVDMFMDNQLEIVAEGAENKSMVDGLSNMKCRFIQGYYYSRPIPEAEFIDYIRTGNEIKNEGNE